MSGPAPTKFDKAEMADLLQKLKHERQTKSDPIRDAIMDALMASKDPRVAAVRRKCSLDQLRALVECVASAPAVVPNCCKGLAPLSECECVKAEGRS